MKMDELEETLESQEELLRLERETSKTLDKDLAYERKENKRIKDSLKTNDNILLGVRELLTSEKEKVNDLTKKYSLVEDTNANLRSENAKLQESFTSLQAIHKALEVEHNTTRESNSKASEKSSSSIPSTSNGCVRCYNIDIQTCATNHIEMNAMKEISRLTQLLQEEIFPIEQASKANPGSRVGEFEKHTKGFGSRYMSKFGFEKGKGLGKNEQGIPQSIPYVKNNKTATLGANGGLVKLSSAREKRRIKHQVISNSSREELHVKRVPRLLHYHQSKTSSRIQANHKHKNRRHMYPFMRILC